MFSMHSAVHVPLNETGAFLFSPATGYRRLLGLRIAAILAGKPLLMEKTPRHVLRIDTIRRCVYSPRFIVMVRDGRDVVASLAARNGGNLEEAKRRWLEDTGRSAAEIGKPDVLILRYEDLIEAPATVLQTACGFLGVPYEAAMLEYHRRPRRWYGLTETRRTGDIVREHHIHRNWQVNQPIFDGRGRWKRDLSAETVAWFGEGRARELMETFGYVVEPG
jgi:hypothetical protein